MSIQDLISKSYNRIIAYINFPLVYLFVFYKPIKTNKYFFISMLGDNYGCNVKALSDYIGKIEPNAELVWGFSNRFYDKVDCACKKTKLYTFSFYYHILTAKYIIGNATMNKRILHKRPGQIYLQTWHGTTIKRIGIDANVLNKMSSDNLEFDANEVNLYISGSTYMAKIINEKLCYKGQVQITGYPRNDIFFKKNLDLKNKVYSYFNIPTNKKIILYAPTFRDDFSFDSYDVNLEYIKSFFGEGTSDDYVILVRLHALMLVQHENMQKYFGNYINATYYPDMQELLYCSDILITDYSSSMFDFMYSYKPIIVYAKDYRTYERGFYMTLGQLPFIVAYDNDDLKIKLQEFSYTDYKDSIDDFIKSLGSVEDGCATERVYQLLKSI